MDQIKLNKLKCFADMTQKARSNNNSKLQLLDII